MTNENIAPSSLPIMLETKEGMPSGASPSLGFLVVLGFYLGLPFSSPSLGSCYSLFHNPSNLYPKLENFNHTKLDKTFVRSVSIIKQITTLSIVANPFIFYYCIIPTVL